MVGNQLRILPPEIGQLTNLRVLAADSNQLTILPGEGGRARCGWTAVQTGRGCTHSWLQGVGPGIVPIRQRPACCASQASCGGASSWRS